MDATAILTKHLGGSRLVEAKRLEHDWRFGFGGLSAVGLTVSCPWRILVEGRIAFAGSDDGHKFGLPAPLDGEEVAQRLLGLKAVEGISIRSNTGDLSIAFSGRTILEVLNTSSGYEGWVIGMPGISIIGMGGGEIVVYEDDRPQ